MIGFNHLGNLGRLGNQMFEFAALRGIAEKHGYDVCIPPKDHDGIENYSLHKCFYLDHIPTGFVEAEAYVQEEHFHFNEKIFEQCPDNVSLYGFFQSEKYFKHVEEDIRKDFTFKDNWLNPCKEFREQLGEEVIFLHVRRGDPNLADKRGFKWAYLNIQSQHPVQTLEYYEKALAEFNDDLPVVVFSDSIDWCKEQDIFKSDRFMFSEPEDKHSDGALVPYLDMCLMSLCDHAIIANSSMSWWGAWLIKNPNKKVIAPSMWFGSDYADKDTKDLYCESWKII